MEARLLEVREVCAEVLLLALGMFAIIRGYQVWRKPENLWGLGMSWYISLAKCMMPANNKEKLDRFTISPQLVRTLALMSMVGGGIAVLGVIVMVLSG